MQDGFRFEPSRVQRDRVIGRARITRLLNGRFTHRVTTIVGAAGYGKSTALALAVENNHLDPLGRDVWISAVPADGDPVHLLSGIGTALGVVPTGDDDTIARIVDAVWSAAPDEVCIIIDDAHHLADTPSCVRLQQLLEAMPTNAHLVLASRRPVDLHVARMRAHGTLLEITEADLSLDDDEIRTLVQRDGSHISDPTHLPRHVATADLQLAAGIDAGADFLWEEILSALEPDRLMHLRRAAVLDELDDDLILAITDHTFTGASLLDGIPLVERVGDDSRRMHAILREALTTRLEPGERRKILELAGSAERARHRFHAAAQLFHSAGDDIAAMESARDYVLTPIVYQSIDATTQTKRVVDAIDPTSPVARSLEATSRFGGLEHQLIELFEAAAESARERGDVELEVAAINRLLQALLLDEQGGFERLVDRATELADSNRNARGVAAHFRSIVAQLDGDAEQALLELDDLDALDPAREYVTRASRLCDLGRPEEVALGLSTDDLARLPPGADLFVGLAMWKRGALDAGIVNTLSSELIPSVLRRGFTHPSVSTLATTSIIALTAGDTALAERRVRHAAELSSVGVGASIVDLVKVARSAVTAVRDGDQAAAATFGAPTSNRVKKWPTRGELMAVTLVYVIDPTSRELWERCHFGSSVSMAVDAGAALVASRERDDVSGAAALPWSQPNLMRAHILPTHLVELACAAVAGGSTAAADVLVSTPNLVDLLHRTAEVSGPRAAAVATKRLGVIPRPQPFALHVALLGPIEMFRDGIPVEHAVLTKRPKVRELLALLLERNAVTRSELCELMWPNHHDEDRALANLRTALSMLNDVLEPERVRGSAAFHLRTDGETVALDRRITTDLTRFEELLASAHGDDGAGLPARAVDTYRQALALYRGCYAHGIEAPWVVLTRLRLQSLAGSAMCRVAELTMAKGEPEEAARWATKARQIDPLNERAGRIFVAALEAVGDRTAARTAAQQLLATLRAADLEPTPVTQRVLARLR